ncbi:MAG: chemotaxis protein CheW [Pyrinomonadaceae bacterium]|nr:chemotaxis protein CheW [Pyrinomonadaceae bacterium]
MSNDSIEQSLQSSEQAVPEERARKVQLFRAGSFQFGIFENEVATVAEWREPTPLPHAPESVLGVVSIQGRMLTVLDPALLARGETVFAGGFYRFIIALRGDEQLALAVSDLDEIIEHSNSESEHSTDNHEKFVLEILLRAGSQTRILNVTELFPAALQGRERRRRRF